MLPHRRLLAAPLRGSASTSTPWCRPPSAPLVFALNTLPGILVYACLVTLLWSVGINGDNAVDAIVAPIFLQYLAANVAAMSRGRSRCRIVTAYGFFTTFVNVGGTGATIALALVLWSSTDAGFRKVSRLSLPTQIFQINEPIFFGLPIVLNPVFMIPYVLNALILTTGSYLLMQWDVIHKPFVNVPWTTPPIIGHYLVIRRRLESRGLGRGVDRDCDGGLLSVCQDRERHGVSQTRQAAARAETQRDEPCGIVAADLQAESAPAGSFRLKAHAIGDQPRIAADRADDDRECRAEAGDLSTERRAPSIPPTTSPA